MPHAAPLILTLTGALSAALVLGLLTHRLKLSPIVGYLMAGVLISPFTPGFAAHMELAQELAEVGVILLMFGVGLHFHVKDLWAVRKVAIPGAIIQIAVATSVGLLLTESFGWSWRAGLVFGLSISVASTVVLLRVLADHGALATRAGHIAVGWLIVEDLFTVVVLVLLPLLADEQATFESLLGAIALAFFKIGVLLGFTFLFGRWAIPKLLEYVSQTRSRELFTLAVLVLALGIALGAYSLLGVSMALGAFLAGTVVGQSEFSTRAASDALPMRDAFAVLFFVSMGMLFDPTQLTQDLWLMLATIGVVLLIKPATAFLTLLALKHSTRSALLIGLSLGQIGEFSFIVTALGTQLHVLPAAASQVLVVSSLITITLNPLLFRLVEPLSRRLGSAQPSELVEVAPARGHDRVLVVGYGPVGRIITRLLRDNGLDPVVIELNHQTVQELHKQGISAVYGDASQQAILELAGAQRAVGLIFAAAGSPPEAVVRMAKQLHPSILVLARVAFMHESAELGQAGADIVIAAEAEVALAMAERLLMTLGATAEQLDRERARVRAELVSA
ncbi:MAG: TrkA-N:Sodium/hydrogen exchanger [Myxococcaceae bacterium]|nr:TrkA-N:Sodium/hydrogen exchanger [Myxococcaceae bacterium]